MHFSTNSRRFLPDADWSRCRIRGNTQRTLECYVRRPWWILMQRTLIATLFLLVTLLSFAAQAPDAAYLQSFNKWKAELIDGRKQHWLPLAGLFWLKPGENTFGSAPDNAIVLPSGPAHAGVFERQDKAVTVRLQSGVEAKIGEKIATESKLNADVTNHPTIVELGALRMF